MARIPDEHINRIKQEVSLLRLVESQGYTVKKQGKDYAVQCPFHDDDTPSLIISPKTNLYHCFGCGAAGSVIDWVMETEKLSFREAALKLQGLLDIEEPKPTVVPFPLAVDSAGDQALLQRVIAFYHETLKQSSEAQDYLKSRGLDDFELIDHFKLGYANRSLGLTLPSKQVKAGAAIRGQLQQVGLYRDSGHEHFAGSLVIPVINPQGEVTEVYGRKLLNNLRKGTPKHLYLPGPHSGIFNSDCLASEEIILCESLIDALTFWRHGFKNVTTSYGTQGFTDELLTAFKENRVKRVLIAYDRDDAGNKAAELLAKQLTKAGIDCYRVLFPKGMDTNEYALQGRSSAARGQESVAAALTVNPPRKSLELVIRNAEWLGDAQGSANVAGDRKSRATKGDDLKKQETVLPVPSESVEVPASPLPETQPVTIDADVNDNEVVIPLDSRRYRVRGLNKATSYEQLKINLAASDDQGNLHIDQLDLYNAKQRSSFVKQTAIELGVTDDVIKKDVAKVLLKLEQLQDEQIQQTTEPIEKTIVLTDEDQQQALELLCDPSLLSRILDDFNAAGVVGEETNKLMGYLAAVSRKLDNPLAVIIQSTSAAGKSSLMNAVLTFMPEEERIQYSAMTGQSLFYMGQTNLKHKILAIAEEEGADQASYALKLLQSEGELTIASTGKDADGNLTTQEYRVEGPVMLFSTTTAIDIDEELMNRCVVLTVNESREQTQLIHELQRQRETLEGLLANETKKQIVQLHRNAQRLLKPLKVVNPFANQLTFMSNQTRSRRDHMKYLGLIKTVALLHQYQREVKTVLHNGETLNYIEVELNDIAVANQLASDVLGRSLNELPPQTQSLLDSIEQMVKRECTQDNMAQRDYRFSRKQVRDEKGWSDFQVKKHMQRLEELEYVLIHNGGRGKSIAYELLYQGEGKQGDLFLMGLIDVQILGCDDQKEPLNLKKEPPSSPQSAPKLRSSSPEENTKNTTNTALKVKNSELNEKTHNFSKNTNASYRTQPSPLAASSASV